MTPKAPKEQRETKKKRTDEKERVQETLRTREPREKQQPGGFAANCRFETASMGESGVIYEAEQQGRTVIVRWNSDHAFYKRFVLENVQGTDCSCLGFPDLQPRLCRANVVYER